MNRLLRELIQGIITITIIAIVLLLLHNHSYSLNGVMQSVLYTFCYGLPLYFGNSWLFDYLNKKYPWHNKAQKRFILGLVYSIGLTMAIIILINMLLVWYEGGDIKTLWDRRYLFGYYATPLIITIIVSLFFHALGFYHKVRVSQLQEERLKVENMQARYEALKAQVDPHFLFNGLSALSSLIEEDPVRAQTFVHDLSGIYRYVLEQRKQDLSSLKEELSFADKYIALQKTRFEDGLSYEVSVATESLNKRIVSLSLQMLLENIFKHNLISKTNPVHIRIKDLGQHLLVENNLNPRKHIQSNKTGLANIQDRYTYFTNSKVMIENSDHYFKIKIPYIDEGSNH